MSQKGQAKVAVWMPLYIGDYLRDTMHLSTLQHGAYLLLLAHYWVRGCPLPDKDTELSAITRMTPQEWQEARPTLASFFQVGGGLWVHKRVEAELAQARDHKERQAERTKAALLALARKRTVTKTVTDIVTETATVSPSPSPSPIDLSPFKAGLEQPVELPFGFPKSKEEAETSAAFIGCEKAFAVTVWHKAMSRGGHDAKDIPIRNWRSHLATEWSYEQARRQKEKEQHGSSKPGHRPSIDRNAGTANEGRASAYKDIGKL